MSLSSRGWQGRRFPRGKPISLRKHEQWSVSVPLVSHSALLGHANYLDLSQTGTNETNSALGAVALRIRCGAAGNGAAGAW